MGAIRKTHHTDTLCMGDIRQRQRCRRALEALEPVIEQAQGPALAHMAEVLEAAARIPKLKPTSEA